MTLPPPVGMSAAHGPCLYLADPDLDRADAGVCSGRD
jgi:hypothetical protein